MANVAARETMAFFTEQGLNYEVSGEDEQIMLARFGLKNKDVINIIIVFDDNTTGVNIHGVEIARVDDSKLPDIYKLCNELNMKYRWAKFFVRVSEHGNSIEVEDDAVIQLDSCGAEVLRCCFQIAEIVDEVYPNIMRTLYV